MSRLKLSVLAVGALLLIIAFFVAVDLRLDREQSSLEAVYEKLDVGDDRDKVEATVRNLQSVAGYRRFKSETYERIVPGPVPLSFILVEYESNTVSYVGILAADRHDVVRKEKGKRKAVSAE